jgi:hypothetical protein
MEVVTRTCSNQLYDVAVPWKAGTPASALVLLSA